VRRRRPDGRPTTLTPEQEALFEGVSDVPAEAASAALREHGALLRHLTEDEVLSLAVIGGMEATASHKAEAGPLRQWVFFGALHRVLDNARAEHKRHAKVLALVRAAAALHWSGFAEAVEIGDEEAELRDKLHAASDGFYAQAALRMAAAAEPPDSSDAEEELGLRRAAAWAGDALRAALEGLTPQERWILEQHFRAKQPLTTIAAELGVKPSQYRTFVRDFHRLLGTLGGRLRTLGMKEMPAWWPEVSGTALGREG
jgi:DNA-directed RNA polymerase specialized sigma24 family protein